MKALLAVDAYKMWRSKVVKILLALAVVSAGLMVYFAHQIAEGKLNEGNSLIAFFSDMQIFSLLGSIIMGLFFCNDFEEKIVENAISSGQKRWNIVFSKIISLLFLSCLFAAPYIGAILLMKFLDLPLVVYLPTPFFSLVELVRSTANIGRALILCGSIIVVYTAQLSIGLPILFGLKKPVLVMSLNYILLGLLGTMLNSNDALKDLIAWTPYGIDFQQLVNNWKLTTILQNLAVSFFFMVCMVVISFVIFKKAEVK